MLKVIDRLQDYLTCEKRFSDNKKKAWLKQLYMVESLEKKFRHPLMRVLSYKSTDM